MEIPYNILQAQVKKLGEIADGLQDDNEKLQSKLDKAEAENKRLREALEYIKERAIENTPIYKTADQALKGGE